MDRKSFPWKILILVGILGVLAAVFFVLTPKREPVRPPVKMSVAEHAATNVAVRVVKKDLVVTNVVQVKTIESAKPSAKLKDGKYTCETPEGEWSYHVNEGKAWLGGDDKPALYPLPRGRLRLPESLDGTPITGVDKRAFAKCFELTSVEVPDGYDTIGRDAFWNCESLAAIQLPKSMSRIDKYAFVETKIRTLDLNRLSEWNPTVIAGMPCLETITFDPRNRQFVVRDGMVLSKDETKLYFVPRTSPELRIPSGVTSVEERACERLAITSLVVPGHVRKTGLLSFYACERLRSVRFSPGDIHLASKTFWKSTNLVELVFAEGLKHLDEWAVFCSCTSLRELNLPDSLETMGAGTFENATSLERIRFGRALRRIGYRSFGGATSLKSVTLPTSIREMCAECFKNCRSLKEVRFEGDAPTLVDNGDGQRGVDIFMGTPRDLVVYVKRGSKGWNPNGEGLPKQWPVGAGGNARRIAFDNETEPQRADTEGRVRL